MKLTLPFFIGYRYTRTKRRSQSIAFLSRVSMVGLAVGVCLLILVLSVMNGFDRELKERILGLVPQAAIYHRQGIEDWRSVKQEIEAIDGVSAAAPFVEVHGLVSFKKNADYVLLLGFDPVSEGAVSLINQYVDDATRARLDAGEQVILLGRGVADKLGVVVGSKIMLVVANKAGTSRGHMIDYFEVAQIVESRTQLDASLALTSLTHAAKLTSNKDNVTGMRIKLDDLFEAPTVVYQTTLSLGSQYYGSHWMRTHWNLYSAIQMSKNLVGLLMSLIVAIAAFNVVSTLVLVVVDKQGDIAILRTLGASTRQVMGIFISQGLTIGFIGTGVGAVMGCLLSLGAQDFVSAVETLFNVQFLKSDVYPLTYLPTEIRVQDIVSVTSLALGMSLLATVYPAWKATRIQPAEALRYE